MPQWKLTLVISLVLLGGCSLSVRDAELDLSLASGSSADVSPAAKNSPLPVLEVNEMHLWVVFSPHSDLALSAMNLPKARLKKSMGTGHASMVFVNSYSAVELDTSGSVYLERCQDSENALYGCPAWTDLSYTPGEHFSGTPGWALSVRIKSHMKHDWYLPQRAEVGGRMYPTESQYFYAGKVRFKASSLESPEFDFEVPKEGKPDVTHTQVNLSTPLAMLGACKYNWASESKRPEWLAQNIGKRPTSLWQDTELHSESEQGCQWKEMSTSTVVKGMHFMALVGNFITSYTKYDQFTFNCALFVEIVVRSLLPDVANEWFKEGGTSLVPFSNSALGNSYISKLMAKPAGVKAWTKQHIKTLVPSVKENIGKFVDIQAAGNLGAT
mmetsp:Transcript_2167/g.6544  ORF Transcript_2167/g.6544 Transcript_2167/m.6544 type:complete len:384 (+) Transcript_2167:68-1219(+)